MITCRRHYLDSVLTGWSADLTGLIVDIGGKKRGARGRFRPLQDTARRWLFVNPDLATAPDIVARGEALPLSDGCADAVLLCEVLEHVAEPATLLAEARRVLKPGGRGVITVPFLNQAHPDPDDFQRWTDTGLTRLLSEAGLTVEQLDPMGGVAAVIYDLGRAHFYRTTGETTVFGRLGRRLIRWSGGAALALDRRLAGSRHHITTGWAAMVRR